MLALGLVTWIDFDVAFEPAAAVKVKADGATEIVTPLTVTEIAICRVKPPPVMVTVP